MPTQDKRIFPCLLRCLQASWDRPALQAAQRLAEGQGFDWQGWAELARREQVQPPVYAVLRGQAWAPPALLDELHLAYVRNGSRNTLLLSELSSVIERLAQAGIESIVLKGAALVETVYGNVALRVMSDLDLLLRRDDVPAAIDVVSRLGFAPASLEPRPGINLEYESQVRLNKLGPLAVALELHWGLIDSPFYQARLPMDWFWQTAGPARLRNGSVLILGPEAQVLHLCAHLALHHGGGDQPVLLWQHDVALVLHAYQDRLDWDLVLAKARAFDLVLPLREVLEQVQALWPLPAPQEAVQRMRELRPSPAESAVYRRLTGGPRPVAQRFWGDLVDLPGWRPRASFVLANLFPAPEYMRQRYALPPRFPILLSYPYRWAIGCLEALSSPRARR